MLQNLYFHLHHLSYFLADGQAIFNQLSLSFANTKMGLVGRNGIGKTTLFKLLTGEILPTSGSISRHGKIAYMSQNPLIYPESTVAQLLGFKEKLDALARILQGSLSAQDFTTLNDEWDIEQRLQQQLSLFQLDTIAPDRLVQGLSGGEQTRLLLTQVFYSDADIILLDEPTNHLDSQTRVLLYSAIDQWQGGLIVISHDRSLLNYMEQIVELTSLGAQVFGGNYQAYQQQKILEKEAAKQMLKTRTELLNRAKQITQIRRERHEQNEAKGLRAKKAEIQAKGSYDKLRFKSAQGRSESTNRRIRLQSARKLEYVGNDLHLAKEKVEVVDEINVQLPATYVPNGKILVEVNNLHFRYPQSSHAMLQNMNLIIQGAEHLALVGPNGSGKTTLVKLILGELQPTSGDITLGTTRIAYLDQNAQALTPELSVLENFQQFNPEICETNARLFLAQFLFKNTQALKTVQQLSGGEKLRAQLACLLMAAQPPQLLILDEPTNHLDFASIFRIESALKCYQGAMIVISHDACFLNNIGITRQLKAPFY